MSLKLYMHPLSSYCWKVLIALYEVEVAFTPEVVNLGEPDARAAFTALWPTTKIPLLQDEARGRVVPETTIQIEYVDRHYAGRRQLFPADPDAQLEARLWDRLSDAYVMTPMQQIVGDKLRPAAERSPRTVADARALLAMAYDMFDRRMAGRVWAAGAEFSVADCAAAPALFYASIVAPFAPAHTHLAAYFERLLQRASVARAVNEARPWFKYFPFSELIPQRFLDEPEVHA